MATVLPAAPRGQRGPKRLDTRAAQLGALASKPDHLDMRDIVVRLSFALMAATTTACGADRVTVCGGLEVVGFTRPDTATIKVGASTIAIAGED